LHGGSVSADSDGPGKGSRFTIRLPAIENLLDLTPAVPLGASVALFATQPVPTRRKSRILIVDDNVDAVEALAEVLGTLGYEVVIAYDGPQALIALESFDAEVAILDIGLPVMDGYELAGRIRGAVRGGMPRLVALTGYSQPDDLRRSREAGFDKHLVKPVNIASLTKAIEGPDPTSPLEPTGAVETGGAVASPTDEQGSTRPRVVLVERDRHICDLVTLFLERVGFTVERADTGYLGLERVRRLGHAIVITEVLAPELDGLALCRLIKADPALRAGVIVQSMLSAAEQARQAGADAFLMKPIEEDLLVSTVNDIAATLSTSLRGLIGRQTDP
jgi:CheY-like chemotaxis protein